MLSTNPTRTTVLDDDKAATTGLLNWATRVAMLCMLCVFRPDLEQPSALCTIALLRGQTASRVYVACYAAQLWNRHCRLKIDFPDSRARVAELLILSGEPPVIPIRI